MDFMEERPPPGFMGGEMDRSRDERSFGFSPTILPLYTPPDTIGRIKNYYYCYY